MSYLADPPLVKYFLAAFGQDAALLAKATETLSQSFLGGLLGEPDHKSNLRPIVETTYYDREMGSGLVKVYLSWPRLLPPDRLVELKLLAMDLERDLAETLDDKLKRKVNLDPGYVFGGGLVLATGKYAGHRLYLGQKIWGELTLFYRRGFQALPWTYRDYRDPEIVSLLNEMRQTYLAAIKGPAVKAAKTPRPDPNPDYREDS
ncbi:MAG: DUF4416 family protein [Deltaproteobacteria bacterium]|jgi:hypothetical protein|nr:DUF4416 family protein [Deltaproteobacteria bacterium]